jgi:hypothetical protein
MKRDIAAKANTAKAHPPARTEVKQAQDAAMAPADDKEAQAKAAQADKMDAARPSGFDKAGFVAAVNAAVAKQAPQNLDEADKFAGSGKADQIKGEVLGKVTSGKAASTKEITDRTHEAPNTPTAVEKPVTPLPTNQTSLALASPDASTAVPDKAPAEQTDLRADQCETDHKMADAGVTEQQLAQSNESEFTGALASKKEGEQHTAQAPTAMRDSEARQLAGTTATAQAAGQAAVMGMTGAHATVGTNTSASKSDAKTKDEQSRAKIAGDVKAIFDETRAKVETVLNGLDDQVGKRFDAGESDAKAAFTADHQSRMDKYKDDRYAGLAGKARWVRDQFAGLPDEANGIYLRAMQVYTAKMQTVISGIADFIGEQLGIAKQHIADGRARVKETVSSQPPALRKIAGEAANEFGGQFDDLAKSVDDKQDSLVEDLARKYTAARGAIDDEIKNLQAENKGLWDKAKDAIGGAIETILALKDMLLSVLSRAAGAVSLIIAKPIEFLGNLVNAVKTGVMNFAANIIEHLKQGLKGWLLGNLASAGIEIPETFDAKGILRMVLSILGLTWGSVRARILKFIPEPVLSTLERTVEVVGILVTEGLPGLWKWVVGKLGDLKELVLGEIKEFVIEKIVKSGITWIVALLNPAAAFIKACKAIYDIVMFFVEQAAQIKEFVDSVLDSVESIARGGVGAVAGLIEQTLAKALPMVLGFLASLLGLGGISEKIRTVLEKVQAPVAKVVDTVVGAVVKAGKKLLVRFGFGKKKPTTSEDKTAVLTKAKQAADTAMHKPGATRQSVEAALPKIKDKYQLTSIALVPVGSGQFKTHLEINPKDDTEAVPLSPLVSAEEAKKYLGKRFVITSTGRIAKVDRIDEHTGWVFLKYEAQRSIGGSSKSSEGHPGFPGPTFLANAPGGGPELVPAGGGINQTMYTLDGKLLRPEYRRVRAVFYGGSNKYKGHTAAKIAEVTRPDGVTFNCPGVKALGLNPHVANLLTAKGAKNYALDHQKSVAGHWNSEGRKGVHSERASFYVDPANLQVLCKACNSAKGSLDPETGARPVYEQEVEIPRFTGKSGRP